MCNADPHDAAACLRQLLDCAERGCDLFRMTVPDVDAARVLGEVRRKSPIPVVADIHFDWRCALAAIEAGTDALRLNPGNIGSRDRVQAVARAAKEKGVPVRIGVNGGSLEKGETLVSSALKHLKILEDEGFRDVVISAKASNVAGTLATYRELAERTDCPLHLGVTEAGTLLPGAVRSSVALGILLSEGIGDTIRVSLTGKPEKEVKVGLEILRSLGLRAPGPAVTSCPTCGRTKVDLVRVATQVEEALEVLHRDWMGDNGENNRIIELSNNRMGAEGDEENNRIIELSNNRMGAEGDEENNRIIELSNNRMGAEGDEENNRIIELSNNRMGAEGDEENNRIIELSNNRMGAEGDEENNRIIELSNNRMGDARDEKNNRMGLSNDRVSGGKGIRLFDYSTIRSFPKVAVMGCAVNGPGEAKDADVALCGGDGDFLLYVRGKPVGRVSAADAVGKVIEHVLACR